jgi:MazG family protein
MSDPEPTAAPCAFGDPRKMETLRAIMRALRNPAGGCPWDLEQTFATIAPYTIEEAYEVADAIERGDVAGLREELGDLLLQVVYHATMAEEAQSFRFEDVVEAISTKMIRRHPHVFGDQAARSAGAAKGFWEGIKAAERIRAAPSPDEGGVSARVLDGVPTTLPAMTRAVKLQRRAARVGFDWAEATPILDKASEEIGELALALRAGDKGKASEELGDLLFVAANLARHMDIDPEAALRQANAKFVRRFGHIEDRLAEVGRRPQECTLAELDALWDEAKAREAAAPPIPQPDGDAGEPA